MALSLYLFLLKKTYNLRSGCELIRDPKTTFNFESYDKIDEFSLTEDEARELYIQSIQPLKEHFSYKTKKFNATEKKLEKLIKISS